MGSFLESAEDGVTLGSGEIELSGTAFDDIGCDDGLDIMAECWVKRRLEDLGLSVVMMYS